MNSQGEIDEKYEEDDMDHAVASHNLRQDADKAQDRANRMKAFYEFLDDHPDFKLFYDLSEAAKKF